MNPVEVTIRELGQIVTGKTPSTANPGFFDGDYQFVTPSDLGWRTYYCRSTERTVTEQARQAYGRSFVPAGAVMVTCIGNTIGKCAISSGDCLTNQQINSIIPEDGTLSQFVYYLLIDNTAVIRGVGIGGGSATPILNKTTFSNTTLLAPPRSAWSAIATALGRYDDLIGNNTRRIALLEQAARTLYEEWFVRLRFPGREHTRITAGVPAGWEKKVLGDVCEEVREQVSPANFEPDTPYIGLEHIPRRSITLAEWGSAAEVTSTKHRYHEGEVLFGKIRCYFHKVGIAFTDGVTSSDAIVIRPASDELRSLVLMTVSSDHFVRTASQTAREGSKMPRADWKLMQQYPVPLPPPGILAAFNGTIEPMVKQLKVLALQSRKAREARDLLLPRLMNGEIAV